MTAKCFYPSQVVSPPSLRSEELLLLCHYDPNGISTVPETVAFMQKYSRFSVTVLNLFEHGKNSGTLCLSPHINLRKFDGIVIHNSLSYNVDNLRSLDSLLEFKIRDFTGVKVLMKQDENFKFKELASYIGDVRFDLIFTCLPPEAIPVVYPASLVGAPTFVRMLTGYITPTLRNFSLGGESRKIDVGYRGSIQPLNFGRLAYEKRKIGDDFAQLKQTRDLTLDISSRWEDRLGSGAWLEFLASCKATLGVESGASVFDLDGDLVARCASAEKKYGPIREDAEYAEHFLGELADIEGKINYNQISPRHFEAAATRTLQIMYPGYYSGIFKKGRHYVELARDYSNIEQVLEILRDENLYQEIVDRAYDEIVCNSEYWIETFAKRFDQQVARMLIKKELYAKPPLLIGRNKKNLLLLCAHKPSIDPRLEWVSKCAPSHLQITQVGVLPARSEDPRVTRLESGRLVLAEPTVTFHPCMLRSWMATSNNNSAGWIGLAEISYIASALALDESSFLELFGAPAGSDRVASFKWYLRYILNTTATLVSQVDRIRGYSAIIVTDLDALPASLIVKGMTGVPIVYDAHEYWPEADVASFEFEKMFWVGMERRLVQAVEHCQTVSPGLAKIMSEQYGREFHVVPNCEPLASAIAPVSSKLQVDSTCQFIFQGNFAPKRGIDLLIDAWPGTEPGAILVLRGPDNDHKDKLIDRARKTGLLGARIKFLPPVGEHELVAAAKQGDVGLIPYTPSGANYSHCCPNKTSQYMAAGLPILANNTSFVRQIIESSKTGLVVDFAKPHEIIKAVSWFLNNPEARRNMGQKAEFHFKNEFNWNKVSEYMYKVIEILVEDANVCTLRVFPERIRQPLYFPIAPSPTPTMAVISEQSLQFTQKVWRLLPVGFRYKCGSKIRSKLNSIFR
jgi:glycosyltransferase involved in cell wall biosynthesis